MLEENRDISCPYCGARLTILVDLTEGDRQEFSHNCEVCCRPIEIRCRIHESLCEVSAATEF